LAARDHGRSRKGSPIFPFRQAGRGRQHPEKAKAQKKIIRYCLDGTNDRAKVEGRLPGWMAFPVRGLHRVRQPLKMADEWARVLDLFATA
jgi:hypothetical protein